MMFNHANPVLSEIAYRSEGRLPAVRALVLVLCGIAALAVAAQIKVPFWPVPVTLQTLAVLSIGAAYGPRLGLATILGYLALGAVGVPLFAGPEAGFSYMAGTTGGYLAGFVAATAFLGWAARNGWDRSMPTMALAMLIGNALIYVPGVLWLGTVIGWDKPVLEWGFTNFLLSDAAKLAIAVMVFPTLWRLVDRTRG